jgi:hypothetical protein
MKTYAIDPGSELTFSVDMAPWETVTFAASHFHDPSQATSAELAAILNQGGSLACYTDADGALVLASSSRGDAVTLDIDLKKSAAATALGLSSGMAAQGAGLSPARLVGRTAQPFALPDGAEMTVTVDGKKAAVAFNGLAAGAPAADVVQAIGAHLPGVARARRDGRILLISPAAGPDSMLEVEPGDIAHGAPDAAAILGFTGICAFSRPAAAVPARLICSGKLPGLRLFNLTATPIELYFDTGTAVLPAQGSIALGPADAGQARLQRMIARGIVRIAPGN